MCRTIYQRYLLETVFIGKHGDIIVRFGGRYRELSRTGVEIDMPNKGAMGYESQHPSQAAGEGLRNGMFTLDDSLVHGQSAGACAALHCAKRVQLDKRD